MTKERVLRKVAPNRLVRVVNILHHAEWVNEEFTESYLLEERKRIRRGVAVERFFVDTPADFQNEEARQ
jgi:hypothetical protein